MLDTIIHRNSISNSSASKKILIMYDEEKMFIGDSFILINQLASCKSFFEGGSIEINCRIQRYTSLCHALLKNNPFISAFNNQPWEELDFDAYDIAFVISKNEQELLDILEQRYPPEDRSERWRTALYSMTAQFLNSRLNPMITTVLPPFKEMLDNPAAYVSQLPRELYMGKDEQQWADEWLKSNGLKEHEQLFIVLDSTSERYKLINMDTYHAILCHMLAEETVRILIFDEQGIGKEDFYKEWLGMEKASRFIFAKNFSLRQSLSLLSSTYTRLIFGPCTGLMHCASGIYNYFVRKGLPPSSIPPIVVYTGRYNGGYTASFWWETSPLVTCLIIRKGTNGDKELVVLSRLTGPERSDWDTLLHCNEYLPEMLLEHLPSHANMVVI